MQHRRKDVVALQSVLALSPCQEAEMTAAYAAMLAALEAIDAMPEVVPDPTV